MKLKFDVGERNWVTGKFTYSENGTQNTLKGSMNPSTHINIKLTQLYEFEIGKKEKHRIEVTHRRPLLFAGFRPQMFEIKINGEVAEKYKGY